MLATAVLFLVGLVPALGNHITPAPHPTQHLANRAAKANAGGNTALPLTQYTYAAPSDVYTDQVNPYPPVGDNGRGPQSGYNICNSTTANVDSLCQTLVANSISDFCIWGAAKPNSQIQDIEGSVVAYCTSDKHGTRVIPAGKITAVQFMRTKAYIQITGLLDQTGINLNPADTGGELDPHGADLLGNPLGGLVWSNGLPSGDNTTYKQVIEWNNFVGSGQFCVKLCDPSHNDGKNYCENRYDIIGCEYNMPAKYAANEFTSCEGELQDVVGTYAGADGKTSTWAQPASLAPDYKMPYTPRIPASSNCVTYASAQLFAAGTAAATTTASGAAQTTSGGAGASSPSRVGSFGGSTASSTSSGASPTSTASSSGAGSLAVGAGFPSILALLSAVVLVRGA